MSCDGGVDAVGQLVLVDELCVIEVRVVRGEEEDAGGEKLSIDTMFLYRVGMTRLPSLEYGCLPSTSRLRVGHGPDRRVSGASWAGGGEHWLCIEEPLVTQE